jgi:tetratricopeptide (TPR) repeat protein
MDDAAPRRGHRGKRPTSPDPVEIAMEAATPGEASLLLADHRRLIAADLQHRRWQIAAERAGYALKLLTGLAGAAAAAVLGAIVLQATQADGLVITPFSVPPDLTQRGVTGEALASRLMDQLSDISGAAQSGVFRRSIVAGWGSQVSLEIPSTGVSLDQLEQWLRQKLGDQVQVSGEVARRADGQLQVNARIGGKPLAAQVVQEGELDATVTRLAEQIYRQQDPGGYYLYLTRGARWQEALTMGREGLAATRPDDRARGYLWAATALQNTGEIAAAKSLLEDSLLQPIHHPSIYNNLSGIETWLGHSERSYQLIKAWAVNIPKWTAASKDGRRGQLLDARSRRAAAEGDFRTALALRDQQLAGPRYGYSGNLRTAGVGRAQHLASLHEIATARSVVSTFPITRPDEAEFVARTSLHVANRAQDWVWAVEVGDRLASFARPFAMDTVMRTTAFLGAGRLDEAEALIGGTALDCQPCVLARAQVAEARGQGRTADHWFSEAVRMAPSLPLAAEAWGRARLARGDAGGALEAARISMERGPRFADAIELAGEALLAKSDAAGAARNFKDAAHLTPGWGRLHLKWGQALAALGKTDEAKAKWAAAARMDLTASERAELARVQGGR